MELIDKEKVVAEIEKRIKETESMQPKFDQFWAGQISAFKGVLKIINSIEVKEVDLDFQRFAKEMEIVFTLPSSKTKNTEEEPLNWEYAIAKHFFELGFKAQKGEKFMSEMELGNPIPVDYEKKYKEEVVRATQLWECGDITRENLEYIFPELAESEDERIRKEIIQYIKDLNKSGYLYDEEWIAWLEKQGKQPKKVSIWKHWKDGIAGGAEGEQIFLIKIGRIYSISSCLGCECDYIELSELDKLQRMEE